MRFFKARPAPLAPVRFHIWTGERYVHTAAFEKNELSAVRKLIEDLGFVASDELHVHVTDEHGVYLSSYCVEELMPLRNSNALLNNTILFRRAA